MYYTFIYLKKLQNVTRQSWFLIVSTNCWIICFTFFSNNRKFAIICYISHVLNDNSNISGRKRVQKKNLLIKQLVPESSALTNIVLTS